MPKAMLKKNKMDVETYNMMLFMYINHIQKKISLHIFLCLYFTYAQHLNAFAYYMCTQMYVHIFLHVEIYKATCTSI